MNLKIKLKANLKIIKKICSILDWIVDSKRLWPKDHLQVKFSQSLEESMLMGMLYLLELILWIIHKLLIIEIQ